MAVRWPEGFRSAGIAAGIKGDSALDLGLMVADRPVEWAGVFTTNAAAAAPVRWCRDRTGPRVKALVVNSGNANACTGEAGERTVEQTVAGAAAVVGCSPDEVLVASTGPIGVPLDPAPIVSALPRAHAALGDDAHEFSRSILTTDARIKTSSTRGGGCSVAAVAKGAAMLAPNMATMLAFLVTDADLGSAHLQSSLQRAVSRTFNRLVVDACESTNDSVFLLATGARTPDDLEAFDAAVEGACSDLAEQMARDAEGGTKVVRIRVTGAADEAAAERAGRAVASSVLWRAAVHGADPNWGRVLAAIGAGGNVSPHQVVVSIGDEIVFDRGEPAGSPDLARRWMEKDELTVTCAIGSGPGSATILTTDLSPQYVELNAFVTT